MNKTHENIFTGVLILITLVFLVLSLQFGFRAKIFPLSFSLVTLVMLVLHAVVSNLGGRPAFLGSISARKGAGLRGAPAPRAADPVEDEPVATEGEWREIFLVFLWLAAFVAALNFVHYLLAALIFLVLFFRIMGKISWKTNLIFSISLTAGLYVLFEVLLTAH